MPELHEKYEHERLARLGFNYLTFINNDELVSLKNLYLNTSNSSSPITVETSNNIFSIVKPALDRNFKNYKYFLGHFSNPLAKVNTESVLQQDWNITDQNTTPALRIWIPLELSTDENGGIFVLPYSHLFYPNYRSGSFKGPEIKVDDILKPFIQPVRLLPGEALTYYNSLFHGFYPCPNGAASPGLFINLIPVNSSPKYYHFNPEIEKTSVFDIDAVSLVNNLPVLLKGERPSFTCVSNISLPAVINSTITSAGLINDYKTHAETFYSNELQRVRVRRILIDDNLEQEINDKGYAIVSFLNGAEISTLRKKFDECFSDMEKFPERFTTLEAKGNIPKKDVYNILKEVCGNAIHRLFTNYKMPAAIFYMKRRSVGEVVEPHFDPNLLLNEHLEPHIGLWCPLVDTNQSNGAIQIIPKSHRWGKWLVGVTFAQMLIPYKESLRLKMKTIYLKAGEGLIWDDRIIHASQPNFSDTDRYTVVFRFTHTSANYISMFRRQDTSENVIDVYKQSDDWYLNPLFDNSFKPPVVGNKVGSIINYNPVFDVL